MSMSISEAAQTAGVPASTLRYYEREGILPPVRRSAGGVRVFGEDEMVALRVVHCLKAAGLSIPQIRQFMLWCGEGDASLERSKALFEDARAAVLEQMAELQRTLDAVEFKCWYYGEAVARGSEAAAQGIPEEEIPAEILRARSVLHP